MNKHAYLIIAHKQDYTLYSLLRLLDDSANDIYIHFDKKSKCFCEEKIYNCLSKSQLFFVERTNVSWGAYSLINAELLLLKAAINNDHYFYYHMISGEDLPIKSQKYIHSFFEKYQGFEFVNYESNAFNYHDRVFLKYPFREKIGNRNNFYRFIEIIFTYFQKICRYHNNICNNISFYKGSNWFSVTDSLARFIISKEDWIKKVFSYSLCGDEIFLQTLIAGSDYFNNLFYKKNDDNMIANMRFIDWKRGMPYIFREFDFNELINSNLLFARKFDSSLDKKIIDKIYNYIIMSSDDK